MAGEELMRRCVRDRADGKTRLCGRVGQWLPEEFPPVDRSGRCDSNGSVVDRKQCRRKMFLPGGGGLRAAKGFGAFRDKGGVG